jgi:4'-phosphopantetheinyl transferase
MSGAGHPAVPNFNFNVSHHGAYVAIASEPVALVGMDLMDTQERAKRKESAEVFFGYFDDNFTNGEWEIIKSAGPEDLPMYTQVIERRNIASTQTFTN